jgi:MFS superfamily sulfate permease-like transporter
VKFFPTLREGSPRNDLVAALTLAALAIPEQLATARLAGLPPAQGIAVFAVASLAVAISARHRILSVGADSTVAPVIAAGLIATALPGTAALIALEVGLILCLVAWLRLEWIARLLSKPLAAGMMAGISIHIIVGRLPTALGLDIPGGSVLETLKEVSSHLDAASLAPLLMTLIVAGVCWGGRLISPRLPAAMAALVVTALWAGYADPDGVSLSRIAISPGSWGLALPHMDSVTAIGVLPTALTIAFLCLFQTTVVLRQGGEDGPESRRNAFAAVGFANLASAAIGGFAVNTSPPRTDILRLSGAASQWAGLLAALMGIMALLMAPEMLGLLPAASLAGILVFVALHIFPWQQLVSLVRRSPSEASIALLTMTLVTLLPLQLGLPLAILLSLIYATLPLFASSVVELRKLPGTTVYWNTSQKDLPPDDNNVLVLGLTAPVNFANAEGITTEIRSIIAARADKPGLLVLECAGVLSIDLTGADNLSLLLEELRSFGISVALARVESARAIRDLDRSGLTEQLGRNNIFESVDQAVRSLAD